VEHLESESKVNSRNFEITASIVRIVAFGRTLKGTEFMIEGKVFTLTRNIRHLHRPIANLSCFQKGTSYSGIRIFNNLPQSIKSLRSEKPQFKVALKKCLSAHSFYFADEFLYVQMICITDLYDCVNSYTVIILCVLYAFVCF